MDHKRKLRNERYLALKAKRQSNLAMTMTQLRGIYNSNKSPNAPDHFFQDGQGGLLSIQTHGQPIVIKGSSPRVYRFIASRLDGNRGRIYMVCSWGTQTPNKIEPVKTFISLAGAQSYLAL